ncbi:type IV leader peptidase family protein [Flavobacterium sp. 1]|uniref:prepilin peptidase n=1 Tax=Flavobacterium sp. 1 TaxID=2035200 RepID=UPI000C243A5B|nr:type IV leader peptidase family protein [Flavobacterium sp. 1]
MEIIFTGLLLCLLIVFFQDWKYRAIHVVLPLLIFLSSYFIIRQENKLSNKIMLLNICFFLITLSILTIYMSLKNKRFLNPFQNYFGLGDLLFYIAITPFFNNKNYILFFILSMFFAICLQFTLRKKMKHDTVPLAGFSALFLFIILAMDSLLSIPKISLI